MHERIFFHGKSHKNYYDNLWRKYLSHKEKKIMKITYFVQKKLHKNIIIRLYNAMKKNNEHNRITRTK